MPHLKSAALAALAVVVTASAAWAASPAPKSGDKPHQKPTFETLDANKDGVLTPDELKARKAARAERMFKRVDANADGKIDKAEFDAWKAKRAEKRKHKHGHKHQH